MTLPALRALRRAFPEAHLSVLIKKELASFFDGSSWIDEVIPYSTGCGTAGIGEKRRLIRRLRASDFDLAIVFPRSFSSALWAALGRARKRVGFASDARGLLLTHKVPRPAELLAGHQAHDYLYLLRETLGVSGSVEEHQPDVHAPHRDRMRAWLAARRKHPSARLIALAVAAAYGPAKEWPAARYGRLIDLLAARHGAECVLIGSPGERRRCEEVVAASRTGALIAAGDTSIGEAIALLSLCDGFAGNDSGSMHVAGALGVPTVGIFGSTRPERTAPLGPKTKVLYRGIDCSPCLDRTCRFGHYECLRRIEAEEVVQALADLRVFG